LEAMAPNKVAWWLGWVRIRCQ